MKRVTKDIIVSDDNYFQPVLLNLIDDAIDEAQMLITKAVEKILKNCNEEAIRILSLASEKLDMESSDPLIYSKFKMNEKVWVTLPQKGTVPAIVTGISYDNLYFVNIVDSLANMIVKETALRRRMKNIIEQRSIENEKRF